MATAAYYEFHLIDVDALQLAVKDFLASPGVIAGFKK
jgi:hypothetical protein